MCEDITMNYSTGIHGLCVMTSWLGSGERDFMEEHPGATNSL